MRFLATLCLIALFAFPVNAYKGIEALRGCKSALNPPPNPSIETVIESARCLGFIGGFTDSMSIVRAMKGDRNALFCAPKEGISVEQGARLLVKFLEDHPQILHDEARVAVYVALGKAFPC